jgi:hypothetical protein
MPQHILNELQSVCYEQKNSLHYMVFHSFFGVKDNINYAKKFGKKTLVID